MKPYIELKDLEVYQLSRNLSTLAWEVYSKLDYQQKKIIGDQFIRSVDSVGANIAEGYARYHYLDKARFYHFSRASLSEALEHWSELMLERSIIHQSTFEQLKSIHRVLEVKLNNFITATYKNAKNKKRK
jgi:four helix bundle protein